MAGSNMVVVFVAVAVLLSARKQLLSLRMVRDIRQQLDSVNTATAIYSIIMNHVSIILL